MHAFLQNMIVLAFVLGISLAAEVLVTSVCFLVGNTVFNLMEHNVYLGMQYAHKEQLRPSEYELQKEIFQKHFPLHVFRQWLPYVSAGLGLKAFVVLSLTSAFVIAFTDIVPWVFSKG